MLKIFIEELLGEMATVYKSREYSILIAVTPDSSRAGNPYFKFLNNSNYLNADKIIRILFHKPDYVIHKDGKELWELNNKDKKLLMQILKQRSKKYKEYTNWDAAKFDWNCEYLEEMLDIEDYFNGNYDEEYKHDAGYIKSDLEMPDYTKIQF